MNRARLLPFHLLAILALLLRLFAASPVAAQPGPDPRQQAAALLARMTPEERVGQLFLMTFQGSSLTPESPIYDLIANHHLGGVALQAANNNIVDQSADPIAAPRQASQLIRQLQEIEWNASQQPRIDPTSGQSFTPNYAPLWIALAQEGDGYPYDQILRGLTELPNEMAIGATWTPALATQVGDVLGKELSILGVNLLLGPSLDVLEAPQLDVTNNLGTRTFGGDPYWVSRMGQAYIRGVHQGGAGRVAVAARHFPGHGSSDRLPEEEVATVRKSLDELEAFDLAPFFAVTGEARDPAEVTDALMTSHIRYQGLQGNIRATTRPVSFDPQALSLLMDLPALGAWRQSGGVMVSDDLGNLAVRRFYEMTSQTFDARRVALNAFLSGNDLLYIADFSSANAPDSYTEAVRTLDFFTQKYREDSAFAQRVDASAQRILSLKYRLYASFDLNSVATPASGSLEDLGKSGAVTFEVARRAATLLSPTQADLDNIIPDPPNQNDRIVFISDTRTAQQCKTCPPFALLNERSLRDAVLRLYGPQAGGQVTANNLASYDLDTLQALLDGSQNSQPDLERDLGRANWIVISMLGNQSDRPSYQTLRRFLTERPDLFQQKRIILFAFSAPYYLDATNISKLTAYYALYSKAPQFIDVAAYLLFGELRAAGDPPVSVAGTGYNLNNALFPDPNLLFPLEYDLPAPTQTLTSTVTPVPQPPPEFRMGDVAPLRAGLILDHNGNPVPDGTPVTFVVSYGSDASSSRQVAYTRGGIARTTYLVANPGTLELRAESEAARSNVLRLDIPFPNGEGPDDATASPSPTPEPTLPPTPPPPTPTQVVIVVTPTPPAAPPRPGLNDWLIAVVTSGLLAFGVFRISARAGQVRWGVRAGFLSLIGGLLAYSYLALKLPGSQALLAESITLNIFLFSLLGGILGLGGAMGWRAYSEHTRAPTPST